MPISRSIFDPKKAIFTALSLFAATISLFAQNTFSPYRVTIFQDAAQIGAKGVIKFEKQKADLPLPYFVDPESVYLVSEASETKINFFKVRQDSTIEKQVAKTCGDVLKANEGKTLTLVIDAGPEVDELTGTTKLIGGKEGMVILKMTGGEKEFFLPLNQVKQVIVPGTGKFVYDQKLARQFLEIGIQNEAPFVPIELFSFHKEISWTPICRIRILGSEKARLQLTAMIKNDFANLGDVNVELSTSNILMQGQQNGEIIDAGKLKLNKNEQVAINLRDLELDYTAAYQCRIPWNGPLTNAQNNRFPVDNLLRFNVPSLPGFACEYYAIIDEENRQVANVLLDETALNGPLELNLGQEKLVHVTVLENEIKRTSKGVKIGEISYEKISIEGKILCYNLGQKFIQLQIQRDVKGEVLENDKSKLENNSDDPNLKSISWRVALDKGQRKEVTYKYDTYIPLKAK